MAAPAAVAASTFAMALPVALPTVARAHTSGRGGAACHRIALDAAGVNSHAHHNFPCYTADLTACAISIEFTANALSVASAIRPRERLTPTALARGPPEFFNNP